MNERKIPIKDILDKAIEYYQQEGNSKAVDKLWQYRAHLCASQWKGKDDSVKELTESEVKDFIKGILND